MAALRECLDAASRAVSSGDYATAARHYETASRLEPQSAAIALLENLLTGQPEDADILHNLGRANEAAGATERALTWYFRALALRPGEARTLRSIGFVPRSVERYRESVAYFERVKALDPDWADASLEIASAYIAISTPRFHFSCRCARPLSEKKRFVRYRSRMRVDTRLRARGKTYFGRGTAF